jgi:hypothetical protein
MASSSVGFHSSPTFRAKSMPDRSRDVAFSIRFVCIGTYGRLRPIEGCGLEEEKCCMQQKRCVSFMPHVALHQQRGSSRSKWIKRLEKSSCLRRPGLCLLHGYGRREDQCWTFRTALPRQSMFCRPPTPGETCFQISRIVLYGYQRNPMILPMETRHIPRKADFLHEISVHSRDQPNVAPPAENEKPAGPFPAAC